MPRHPKPRWEKRSQRWIAQVGAVSPVSGKARPVILRDERGVPIPHAGRAAAFAAFARILAVKEDEARKPAGPAVSDLIDAYLAWHESAGTRPRTIRDHEYHLYRFGEFERDGAKYEDRPAASIEVADLTAYRRSLEARGNQTGTVKLAYASVLACWRWGARPVEGREPLRMLPANPFEGLARPRRGKGRRLILAWPVIEELLGFALAWAEAPADPGWHRNRRISVERHRPLNRLRVLALRLIAECGARPHETMELRWDWLIEAERVAVIPSEHTKTGREDRIIGLSPGMAAELARLRRSGRTHPVYVFADPSDPRDEDNPPTVHQFDAWFRGLRAAAQGDGIAIRADVTPYTLRHSFVSQARAGGIDLRELAPAMGHSADVSERTYAHAQLGEIRELMDRARAAREKSGRG